MVFLAEDALRYMKKLYLKHCITMCVLGAMLYSTSKRITDQEFKIKELTKELKELRSKGD